VAGIKDSAGKVLAKLDIAQAQALIDSGVASGGMIPKINGALAAAAAGTTTCIVDGRQPNVLAHAIESDETGTCLVPGKR
jgi:acetylglutamate kinase